MPTQVSDSERSSSQTVKAQLSLRDLVLSGELKAGDRISELSMVERLGISRTPIRMALVRLQEEGFLDALPTGGFAVKGFSERRGLLLLDSRAAADSIAARLAAEAGVAHAINDRFIDNEASRVAIDGRLQQVERIARGSGAAVAMGYAYPVTIERLTAWARDLAGEGLALAPISAVVDRQEVR